MNDERKEKLRGIADLKKGQIGNSEESVKINFIVPLLEALGHDRLDFEHNYKDIYVKKGLPQFSKLIVETKSYDKNLAQHLQQLERYCQEERPLLGIIANGVEIRIYSYWWKYRGFRDRLIYLIKRSELKDERTIKTIDNILSREKLENDEAKEYVNEREGEIELAEVEMRGIEEKVKGEEDTLRSKIREFEEKITEIQTSINKVHRELNLLQAQKIEQIAEVWLGLGLPEPDVPLQITTTKTRSTISQAGTSDEPEYIKQYRNQLSKPNTMASQILRYIQEKGEVRNKELKEIITNKWGYRESGSIPACLKVLEKDKYIEIVGKGDNKVLRATKRRA